jgi:hypothetical protein
MMRLRRDVACNEIEKRKSMSVFGKLLALTDDHERESRLHVLCVMPREWMRAARADKPQIMLMRPEHSTRPHNRLCFRLFLIDLV